MSFRQSFISELTKIAGPLSAIGALAIRGKNQRKKKQQTKLADEIGSYDMEQPAMGTGKGMRPKNTAVDRAKIRAIGGGKRLKKTAEEEAGANVQDVLSEMLAQSQYQPEEQEPFWADQGSTDSEAVEDPAYGHGKGLSDKKAPPPKAAVKKPTVKPAPTPAPKPAPAPPKDTTPVRSGPKLYAGTPTTKVASQFFTNLTKRAAPGDDYHQNFLSRGKQTEAPDPRTRRAPPSATPSRPAPPLRTLPPVLGNSVKPTPTVKPRTTQDMTADFDGPDAKPKPIKPPSPTAQARR